MATVGLIPPYKKSVEERRIESAARKIEGKREPDGDSLADCLARSLAAGHITIAEATRELSRLGLSSLSNSRIGSETDFEALKDSQKTKTKKIYGQNGITSFGRLRVKDAATIMQQEYGRRSLAFATVTLPSMPDEKLQVICEQWGNFANRLVEEVKRELVRNGAPPDIVHCTEIQESRYKKYGTVAPHLHLLWYAYAKDSAPAPGKPADKFAISADWLRKLTQRIIYRVTGETEVSTSAAVDIQRVKKNAAAYLGKYMSKGGKIVEQIKKDGKGHLLPRQWWGITKELRIKVVKSIKTVENSGARNLFNCLIELRKMGIVKAAYYVYVKSTQKSFSNSKISIHPETGEVSWTMGSADISEVTHTSIEKCYGASVQLSRKAMAVLPAVIKVLDICNYFTEEVMQDVQHWISAINSAEMLEDICIVLDSMREIYERQNSSPPNIGLA